MSSSSGEAVSESGSSTGAESRGATGDDATSSADTGGTSTTGAASTGDDGPAESTGAGNVCGDAIVGRDEQCDGQDGCAANCTWMPHATVWEREFETDGSGQVGGVVVSPEGGVYAAGITDNGGRTYRLPVWAVDAADGADLWSDEVGPEDGRTWASGLALQGQQLVVAGSYQATSMPGHEYFRVYGLDGSLQSSYTGTSNAFLLSVAILPNGEVFTAGQVDGSHARFSRVSASTTVEWSQIYPSHTALDIVSDGAGNVYAAGGAGADAWLVRFDAQGQEQWSRTWSVEDRRTWIAAIALDDEGNLRTTGPVFELGADTSSWDVVMHRFAADDGAVLAVAEHDLADGLFDTVQDIVVGPSGRTVACGWLDPGGKPGAANAWVAEVDDDCGIIWSERPDGRACHALAMDEDDFIYLGGWTGPLDDISAWLAKLAP